MTRLPVLRPEELAKILDKLGFVNTRRSKGSHFRYCHPDGRKTTIPFHRGKTVGRGLLSKILRDVKITVSELEQLLKQG